MRQPPNYAEIDFKGEFYKVSFMKKVRTFIITMVAAALIVFAIVLIVNSISDKLSQPEEVHSFGVDFGIQNRQGYIDSGVIDYSACKDKEGDFVLKIETGISSDPEESGNQNQVQETEMDFEISCIVDYRQVPFCVDNKKYISYAFKNSFKQKIIIDKKYFDRQVSDFDIIIRPFAKDNFAEKKDMLMNSIQVERFNVVKESRMDHKAYYDRKIAQVKKQGWINTGLKNTGESLSDLQSINIRKNGEILHDSLSINNKEKTEFDIVLPAALLHSGAIVAYLDSRQISINKQDYIMLDNASSGVLHITIDSKLKKGKYDLLFIGFKKPFTEPENGVWSPENFLYSNRITVYVN